MIQRLLVVLFSIILLVRADSESKYFLGDQGQSCSQVCVNQGMNCNAHIVTDDSPQKFFDLGVNCTLDTRKWWAHDQPAYVTEQGDPNYGKCLGFYGVPGGVLCHQAYHASRRLCRCDMPSKDFMEFGTGVAHIVLTPEEQMIYAHTVAAGDVGVMTHFWITYKTGTDEGVIIRYYVDDEVVPSLKFTPSLAAGVGFYDKQAPWGTDLIGKGAVDGSWYINIRVPFQKNIRITAQHLKGTYDDVYILVRGGTNIPIQIGDVPIPKNAKLQLFTIDQTLHPYAWATLADVPHGSDGLFFFVTMSARSSGPAFLEGCLHLYTSARSEFPGLILGTGTEDYFDSGWFFNGGQFHLPNAGFTHLLDKKGNFEFSAYRFHIQDPIRFSNGMRFVWRNGDILDAAKVKCMVPGTDGSPANPDTADTALQSYAWVYVWSPQEAGITMEVQ